MIPGLSGSLLSHDALTANDRLTVRPDDTRAWAARVRIRDWHAGVIRDMGPASAARTVYDRVAVRLMADLGFALTLAGTDDGQVLRAMLMVDGRPCAVVLASAWGREAGGAWREGVRLGIGAGVRWCVFVNGPVLRVFDALRTYSRRFIEFDLSTTIEEPSSFAVFWQLLNASAFRSPPLALDEAVARSEEHRTEVRASLQHGVQDALTTLVAAFARACGRRRAMSAATLLDESLVVVYRVLFLLFAEARGLVPKWHPTYRAGYTIESLRASVETERRPRGVWEAIQAISRLAHRGCRAGTLRVAPFNGRLFSPAHAPLAETAALDDGAVRDVLLALTTRREPAERRRISYADLGVEQLGGVYERILDFDPEWASDDGSPLVRFVRSGRRKAAGAFYTPRSLTEYVVRRTLAPLVADATPQRILSLRILDPAMGSGAFLVAACRYLSAAYEAAVIREDSLAIGDFSERDRAGFRRIIAQRCLFGVDINPMAVQLARLSLWLATLSADKPLTFLDHQLRTGNSLAGASLADVRRQPPAGPRTASRASRLPLFDEDAVDRALGATISARTSISNEPGDTVDEVRGKERLMASLTHDAAPLARWKRAADLWCAGWFEEHPSPGGGQRSAAYGALLDEILGRGAVLPDHVSAPWFARARATAERERFFHWTLEFPEVFWDAQGRPHRTPGFDAILGNPPWEMLRADRSAEARSGLADFIRGSGTYTLQDRGHTNLFQLFTERALGLVRTGGRLGIVLPSGFGSDSGCATLRRHLFDHARIDTFVSVENRDGLFPIHRALKFLLIAATAGEKTTSLPCRFGVRSPDVLDELPDAGEDAAAVLITGALIAQLSRQQCCIPELRTAADRAIVTKIAFSAPALNDASGWNVAFSRELNATDDREHFVDLHSGRTRRSSPRGRLYPIVEGKQIGPFIVDVASARFAVPARTARTLLDPDRTYARARLAYRDVASSTNRLTLIAAIIPPHVITTHTLFCLRDNVDTSLQLFLCGVFNSFVANYLVRLSVGMHVTVSIIERLRVPVIAPETIAYCDIVDLASRLARRPADHAAAARLQARVAHLYGLERIEFQHVLDTFPLIPVGEREAAMRAYEAAQ
jgi:hypothetical protein